MKKIIFILVMLFVSEAFFIGCTKDGQMSEWEKFWYKESTILGDLNSTHKDVVLKKIDWARTSLDAFMVWDGDTIALHGPAGYSPLADKCIKVFGLRYKEVMLPDTNIGATDGELPKIIKRFLELRRENSAGQAVKKMRLYIPKETYDLDHSGFEWMFTEISAYLVGPLGGNSEWFSGTRDHATEMKIRNILTLPDPEDPWGYNCSAETRIRSWYVNYAEGNNKSMAVSDYGKLITHHAEMRYQYIAKIPSYNAGSPNDYKTKIAGDVVFIDIPVDMPLKK